jgi:hypothetical protein
MSCWFLLLDSEGETHAYRHNKHHYSGRSLTSYTSYLLLISSSMALQPTVGTWPFVSSFLILYIVGRTPWTEGQPARTLPTFRTTQHKHKIRPHKYPCLKWKSNPKMWCHYLSGRRPLGQYDRFYAWITSRSLVSLSTLLHYVYVSVQTYSYMRIVSTNDSFAYLLVTRVELCCITLHYGEDKYELGSRK